jgi:DNA repair exonuclease SbcCD ATPase subunit
MARRRAIEPEELFETANRLKAEGKEVSATALLDALGGGSLRTIYKLLEQWDESHPAVISTVNNEIPADVMAGFSNSWRLVTQAAERNIQAAREKAGEEVEEALKKFQVALDASDKLEAENEALAQQIEDLKMKLAEWEAIAHGAQAESAAHKATTEQLEKQNGKLERDIERLRAEAEEERDQHKQAQNLAKATIEQIKASLKKAEDSAAKFEAEVREQRKIADQKQQSLEKAEEASKADRAERDDAIKEAAELHGQAGALKAQYAQLLAAIESGKRKS